MRPRDVLPLKVVVVIWRPRENSVAEDRAPSQARRTFSLSQFRPDYLQVLAYHNVAHDFIARTRMPSLDEQSRLAERFVADFTVSRALPRCARQHEKSVQNLETNRHAQEVDHGARDGTKRSAEHVLTSKPLCVRVRQSPARRKCAIDPRGSRREYRQSCATVCKAFFRMMLASERVPGLALLRCPDRLGWW